MLLGICLNRGVCLCVRFVVLAVSLMVCVVCYLLSVTSGCLGVLISDYCFGGIWCWLSCLFVLMWVMGCCLIAQFVFDWCVVTMLCWYLFKLL